MDTTIQNQHFSILLIEDNLVNARLVEKMLSDNAMFHVTHAASLVAALDLLARKRFDAGLVDLSLPDSDGLETFLAIQRHAPELAVLVLTGREDESLAARAVELGAQDFLSKGKLNTNELIRALLHGIIRSRKRPEGGTEQRNADVIAFLGCKGGVGVTTLACHAARELKRQSGDEVLLLCLDTNSAGTAFMMDLHSEYTLADAALNLHRLDSSFWKRLVCRTADQIDVLLPPGSARFNQELSGERVHHVLRFTRPIYRTVVVDLGTMNPVSAPLLAEITALYVVTTEELPALKESGRLLNHLLRTGLSRSQVRLILNRRKKRYSVPVSDLEKALGYNIYGTVQDAPDEVEESFAERRFVDPKLPIHKDVARILSGSLGKEEAPREHKGFGLPGFCRA